MLLDIGYEAVPIACFHTRILTKMNLLSFIKKTSCVALIQIRSSIPWLLGDTNLQPDWRQLAVDDALEVCAKVVTIVFFVREARCYFIDKFLTYFDIVET